MAIASGLPAGFNADSYDMIVVGAGYAGSVCARRLAEACGFHVAVIERRDHIAGNAYDYVDDAGILVHKYGPHIYHTQSDRVHQFLSRFTEWTELPAQGARQHSRHAHAGPLQPHEPQARLWRGARRGPLPQARRDLRREQEGPHHRASREERPRARQEVADYVYENVLPPLHDEAVGHRRPTRSTPPSRAACRVFVGDDDRYFPRSRPTRACPPRVTRPSSSACSTTTSSTCSCGVDVARHPPWSTRTNVHGLRQVLRRGDRLHRPARRAVRARPRARCRTARSTCRFETLDDRPASSPSAPSTTPRARTSRASPSSRT